MSEFIESTLSLTIQDILNGFKIFLTNPVVSAVFGAFIGIFIENNLDKIRGNSFLRKIWYFGKSESVYIYTGAMKTEQSSPTLMAMGDIRSFALILSTLQSMHSKKRFYTRIADIENPDIRQQTIVSIGGSHWNHVTRKLANELNLGFKVIAKDVEIPYIEDLETNEKLMVELDANKEIKRTYGYFIKGLNPYNPENFVYIIGGITTYGVLAVAKTLSAIDSFESVDFSLLKDNVKKQGNYFFFLISANISGGNVYNPKIEKVKIIDRDELLTCGLPPQKLVQK